MASCWINIIHSEGNPHWLSGKESSCNAADAGLIPEWRRPSAEGNGNPLQYSCLGNTIDRGAWQAIMHGVLRVRTTTTTILKGLASRCLQYQYLSILTVVTKKLSPWYLILNKTIRYRGSWTLKTWTKGQIAEPGLSPRHGEPQQPRYFLLPPKSRQWDFQLQSTQDCGTNAANTHAKPLQSCRILCSPMDCSPPGSSVHESLQARIPERAAKLSSRGTSQPRDQTSVSAVSRDAGRFFTTSAIWEAHGTT